MIDVRDLRFRYAAAARPAVDGLSFSIPAGEIFGFLGPSGAGKSTTQKILVGLYREFEGQVLIDGQDPRSRGSQFYEDIGVSFEMPTHYLKLTAAENLAAFAALYAEPTTDPATLLSQVGLEEDANTRVSQFSKGMKVRLGFARALLNRARILFLDEPTAGLDPYNARRLKELIREQRDAGVTVFLTTHDMAVADELCDRVGFLVEGRLRCVESPRDLKLRYGERRVRVEFRSDSGLASREFPLEGLGENRDFFALIRENQIETLHTLETTLEGVFIEVTGATLS